MKLWPRVRHVWVVSVERDTSAPGGTIRAFRRYKDADRFADEIVLPEGEANDILLAEIPVSRFVHDTPHEVWIVEFWHGDELMGWDSAQPDAASAKRRRAELATSDPGSEVRVSRVPFSERFGVPADNSQSRTAQQAPDRGRWRFRWPTKPELPSIRLWPRARHLWVVSIERDHSPPWGSVRAFRRSEDANLYVEQLVLPEGEVTGTSISEIPVAAQVHRGAQEVWIVEHWHDNELMGFDSAQPDTASAKRRAADVAATHPRSDVRVSRVPVG